MSLIGGLLFLLNVAHFRAVHWISCTSYLLALFLGLTALLLYSHGLRTRNSRWSYAAAAVLAVAIFAHASTVAITLPLLILTLTAKLPKLKVIHMLIPQFAIAGICGILLISVYPKAPQLVMASRASQPVDLVLNLFWFWGRLITTAHWLPEFLDLAETTVWERTAGFFFFGLSAFLSVRRGLSVLWTVWLIAFSLPFVGSDLWPNVPGPSRYLYLSSLASSFILAWMIYELARWLGRNRIGLARAVLVAIVGVLLSSSILGLRRAEAVSLYHSGWNYITDQEYETGLGQLRRAITQNSRILPPDAYLRLATSGFIIGKSAEGLLQKALEDDPTSPELSMLLGASAFLHKDDMGRQAGEKRVREALESSKDDKLLRWNTAVAFNNLAGFYLEAADHQTAIDLSYQAFLYSPNYSMALLNMGNALHNNGEPGEAIEIFKTLLKLQPSNDIAWNAMRNLGLILAEKGLKEETIFYYQQAAALDPDNEEVRSNLKTLLEGK